MRWIGELLYGMVSWTWGCFYYVTMGLSLLTAVIYTGLWLLAGVLSGFGTTANELAVGAGGDNFQNSTLILLGIWVFILFLFCLRHIDTIWEWIEDVFESITGRWSKGKNYDELLPKPIQVDYIDDWKLNTYLGVSNFPYQSGKALFAKMENDQVHGAMIALTTNTLRRQLRAIEAGLIKRNDQTRLSVYVPGYDGVKHEKVNVYGDNKSLWNRASVLPFQFIMSDGDDIEGFFFTGTRHLTHGDRPQIKYTPNTYDRVYELYDKFVKDGTINKASSQAIHVYGTPKGTNYSLNDIAQLAIRIISENTTNDIFKYIVVPSYSSDNNIPDFLTVELWNVDKNKCAFRFVLPNVK